MPNTRPKDRRFIMKHAIIGSGKIGTALARLFAQKNTQVAIANSRGPETLASLTKELGASVSARSVRDAAGAEMIFLAVPFAAHQDVAKQRDDWKGKIVVDATNAFGVAPEDLGGLPSSEVVARAFVGARVVKAFNHLPGGATGHEPARRGAAAGHPHLKQRRRSQRKRRGRRQGAWLRSRRTRQTCPRRRAPARGERPAWRPAAPEPGDSRRRVLMGDRCVAATPKRAA